MGYLQAWRHRGFALLLPKSPHGALDPVVLPQRKKTWLQRSDVSNSNLSLMMATPSPGLILTAGCLTAEQSSQGLIAAADGVADRWQRCLGGDK